MFVVRLETRKNWNDTSTLTQYAHLQEEKTASMQRHNCNERMYRNLYSHAFAWDLRLYATSILTTRHWQHARKEHFRWMKATRHAHCMKIDANQNVWWMCASMMMDIAGKPRPMDLQRHWCPHTATGKSFHKAMGEPQAKNSPVPWLAMNHTPHTCTKQHMQNN